MVFYSDNDKVVNVKDIAAY